ncbi:cytochrome c biogenesis protein DipZ [Methylobacterium nonmethylotrophicum]|uniref:Redoxin domain-containing protein n=1 Tax=Methylobacterium nonmethylotrophicum TaxID=1141884 RepID=A0A4Z0NPF7_9HYPH|nr:cytochrome c biogenesis protein CcdA [Methylobacterium nonmethylotrophicum]TGD98719.1 redoxin domain-containing protein [Methylobacterium nonmethylotrophicum]
MTLCLAAYLAGMLTIVSPCILPVLPFVLARADRPFVSGTLPLLSGMAAAFAAAAFLAAIGGGWVVQASEAGRAAALVLLGAFAVALVSRRAALLVSAPLVRVGDALARGLGGGAPAGKPAGILGSLGLGAATGLLWTPCAGPILGLVLTGAALNGSGVETLGLLLAYAAGAATSLAAAVAAGGSLAAALRRCLGLADRLRRVLGAGMIAALAAIALGLDAEVLAPLSVAGTTRAEDALAAALRVAPARAEPAAGPVRSALPIEGRLPGFEGATHWLNGGPPSPEQLRGKVRLVHVWTYSCINCIRTLPYLRAWEARYRDQGLAVIGVHAPEFAFERDVDNVARAVRRFAIPYPVALDNDFRIWRALGNTYWPALYVVDAKGRIRHHQFGEGGYLQAEAAIRDLLAEAAGQQASVGEVALPRGEGAEQAPDLAQLRSGETYLGADKAESFASPEGLSTGMAIYSPGRPRLNQWSLSGAWAVGPEAVRLDRAGGGITTRFRARDLHLVLGPGAKPVRFRVTLDGQPPGPDHGSDITAEGDGIATETRLYQLVRQSGPIAERTFEIRFQDPDVRAYAFTFG